MVEAQAFEPHRFAGAAAHYRRGRAAYPPALIRRVAQAVGVVGEHRVLDLGCGPGMLAVGFGYFAGAVLGLDPEPAMLAAAREAAHGLAENVTFREGSSRDLGPSLGQFRLVTMGRSFHWMDRVETLRRLDGLIEPEGAVALFHDRHLEVPDNAWRAGWNEILGRYSGDEAGRARRRGLGWSQHEEVLLESAFCRIERMGVVGQREVSVDTLVARAFSMSSNSPGRVADADGMRRELEAYLAGVSPSGVLREVVEWSAVIAWRAAGRGG